MEFWMIRGEVQKLSSFEATLYCKYLSLAQCISLSDAYDFEY